jgi:hypothetical protein
VDVQPPAYLFAPELVWHRDGLAVWHEGLVRHAHGAHLTAMVENPGGYPPAVDLGTGPWAVRHGFPAELDVPGLTTAAQGRAGSEVASRLDFEFREEVSSAAPVRLRVRPLGLDVALGTGTPLPVVLPPEALYRDGHTVVWHGGVLRVLTGLAVTLAVDSDQREFLGSGWGSKPPGEQEALTITARRAPRGPVIPYRVSWYSPMPRHVRARVLFPADGALDLTMEAGPLGFVAHRTVDA